MTSPRLIAVLSFSAACLMMATAAGSDTAYAQTAENGTGAAASPSLTLGGLTLDTGGPLSLAEDQPRLYLGLAPTQRSLPLASQPLQPGSMGDADIGDGLGTRLTIGQPLGVDFLGGAVDLQAAATVENSGKPRGLRPQFVAGLHGGVTGWPALRSAGRTHLWQRARGGRTRRHSGLFLYLLAFPPIPTSLLRWQKDRRSLLAGAQDGRGDC